MKVLPGEHVEDDHLAPLLHVHQETDQLAVVLVDQLDPVRANLAGGVKHGWPGA